MGGLRWALVVFVVACSNGSACPRPTPPVRSKLAFAPSGCTCEAGRYDDLACVCRSGTCPRDIADGLNYLRARCDRYPGTLRGYRTEGCGHVLLTTTSSEEGLTFVFDAGSRKLVGGSTWTDAPSSCYGAYSVGNDPPSCKGATRCLVCGDDNETALCDEAARCPVQDSTR
ncbi:MAG TPA: hypothetical protein VM686_33770 [Polyangiaceae bacterium]|nr:hypothetical protein [Polyangiaceae bacterium]